MEKSLLVPATLALDPKEFLSLVEEHVHRVSAGSSFDFETRKYIEQYKRSVESSSFDELTFRRVYNLQKNILRRICLERSPLRETQYYNLTSCDEQNVDFISMGVSWSGIDEVRVPRPVNGLKVKEACERSGKKIYTLESDFEFAIWFRYWRVEALLLKSIGDKFF